MRFNYKLFEKKKRIKLIILNYNIIFSNNDIKVFYLFLIYILLAN